MSKNSSTSRLLTQPPWITQNLKRQITTAAGRASPVPTSMPRTILRSSWLHWRQQRSKSIVSAVMHWHQQLQSSQEKHAELHTAELSRDQAGCQRSLPDWFFKLWSNGLLAQTPQCQKKRQGDIIEKLLRHASIGIRHSRGHIVSRLQGPERGWRGWTQRSTQTKPKKN